MSILLPSIAVVSAPAPARVRLLVIVTVSKYVPAARKMVSPLSILPITVPIALQGTARVRQLFASEPAGETYQNVAARELGTRMAARVISSRVITMR